MLSKEVSRTTEASKWQHLYNEAADAWTQGDTTAAGIAFSELQMLSQPYLETVARGKLPRPLWHEAADLVAEVFLLLLKKMQAGEAVPKVKALLSTIVRRRAIDQYRHYKVLPVDSADEDDEFWNKHPDTMPAPEESVDALVDRETHTQIINYILDRLPDEERNVLVYRVMEQKTVAETAKLLGLTVDKVKDLHRKGLARAHKIAEAGGISHDDI